MNKTILCGNLSKDVELMTTNNDTKVAKLSVAVKRPFSEETDFFTVVVWKNQAENCSKFLSKGSKVGIVGYLQNRSYEDANGTKKYVTEIVAEQVEFLSSKAEEKKQEQPAEIDDDDLPF